MIVGLIVKAFMYKNNGQAFNRSSIFSGKLQADFAEILNMEKMYYFDGIQILYRIIYDICLYI